MWIWRRMLKISWVDKVSNAEVLQKVQENKSILDTVQHCKLRWIGHILRHDSLLRDIPVIEGRMKGKVTRGRKWLQMLSDVVSKSYEELKREVEDRSWCEGRHKHAIQGRKPKRYTYHVWNRREHKLLANSLYDPL